MAPLVQAPLRGGYAHTQNPYPRSAHAAAYSRLACVVKGLRERTKTLANLKYAVRGNCS